MLSSVAGSDAGWATENLIFLRIFANAFIDGNFLFFLFFVKVGGRILRILVSWRD